MKMEALKRVKYPHGPTGREYAPGEKFEALSDRDAKALSLVGKAKILEVKKANPVDLPDEVMKPKAKAMEPEPAPQEAPVEADVPLRRGRFYQRRDMKARE